jgi:hypothetical protein
MFNVFNLGTNGTPDPGSSSSETVASLSVVYSQMREEQRILKSRLADLESRTEERAVQIGEKWFTSKSAVKAFILNEMGSDTSGVGLLALDAVSVFQLMMMDFGSRAERFDQEHKGTRVDMEDPVYQAVFHSYGVEVPECMGGSVTTSSNNPTKLMKIESFATFNGNGDLYDGLKNRWSTEFNKMEDSYAGAVERAGLSQRLEMLILKLKNSAVNFADRLLQFMVDLYNTYGASTGLVSGSRWDLVQRLTRVVWHELAKVRRKPAYITARNAKSESAEYLWACLQSHRIQQEFLEKKFVNHPAVAPILTSHMLTIVGYKEDIKKSNEALTKMQANLDKQLKTIHDLATKANTTATVAKEKALKALSSAPAKKKKKGGAAEDDEPE